MLQLDLHVDGTIALGGGRSHRRLNDDIIDDLAIAKELLRCELCVIRRFMGVDSIVDHLELLEHLALRQALTILNNSIATRTESGLFYVSRQHL